MENPVAVEVYRNRTKKCWSVRSRLTKKVFAWPKTLVLVKHPIQCQVGDYVTFVVQPGGRDRMLRQNKRNVHAFVRGWTYEHLLDDPEESLRPGVGYHVPVSYVPQKAPTFLPF